MGAAALLVASGLPGRPLAERTSRSTRCGRRPRRLRVPIVFHVGGTGDLIDPSYFRNGLPIPKDFHGGEENFRSVDYMGIPHPPMQTLATMIFDGVLERFPALRFGVIEQGAIWLPSWMQADGDRRRGLRPPRRAAAEALAIAPVSTCKDRSASTPYPTEDVGWITEQVGPEICLFSTDYPHVEGGRRPFERFERSLGDASEAVRQRFYADNFVDLMGAGLQI